MSVPQQIITIAVIVLGTVLTRALPFIIFPEGRKPPRFITYLGTVLPSAVIGMLIVYCLREPLLTNGLPMTATEAFRYCVKREI